MKTTAHLVILILSVLILQSCKNSNNEQKKEKIQLDKTLTSKENNVSETKISNDKCKIRSVFIHSEVDSGTFTYNYAAEKLSQIVYGVNDKAKPILTFTYSNELLDSVHYYAISLDGTAKMIYDSKNQLIQVEGSGKLGGIENIEYSNHGDTITIIRGDIEANRYVSSTVLMENGNPVKLIYKAIEGKNKQEYSVNYEYDDKINPFKLLYNPNISFMGPMAPPILSKNNLIKVSLYGDDISKIEYEYNQLDYPTSIKANHQGKEIQLSIDYACNED